MRRPTRLTAARIGALALATVGLAPFAPAAAGDTTDSLYAKMKQGFTTAKPGAWSGWSFDGVLEPFAPGVQPPPQRGATLVFPRGTRFDLTGAPSCGASGGCGPASCSATDEQIIRDGLSACPRGSRVGTGEASLFLGMAGTLNLNVYQYLARPGFALAFATEGGSVLRVLRATVHRNRVSATFPPLALPGGHQASVTRFSLTARRAGNRRHPMLRTPPTCPNSGRWTFTYLLRYDEPHGVQRSTNSVPCAHHRDTARRTEAGLQPTQPAAGNR